MKLRTSSPLFWIVLATIIGFVLHKVFCYLWIPKVYEASFLYSILELYVGFGMFSVLLIFILQRVKKNAIDQVGFTFMGLTCFKMVIAYIFLHPILAITLPKTPTEKINFFVVFIYFLAIETLATIRILNNTQQNH